MVLIHNRETIIIDCEDNFSLKNTLSCGQCFRWVEADDGVFHGVASRRYAKVWQEQGLLKIQELSDCEAQDKQFWVNYFAFDDDYHSIEVSIKSNEVLKRAFDFSPGIRILVQDPWEVLISFIISQNNNITRIKKIVQSLCELAGDKIMPGVFAFPSPQQLLSLDDELLLKIKSGFRATYIKDATRIVATGELDLNEMLKYNREEALLKLMRIKGVGVKVASCVLLYGFSCLEVVPADVWVKRGMSELFPRGWPDEVRGIEGVAAQYLYNYVRLNKLGSKDSLKNV